MLDEPHSLEDWVAIKEAPFDPTEPRKTSLRFIVNWNDSERNLSITCHETRPRNIKRTLKNSAKAAPRTGTGKSQSQGELSSWSGVFTLQDISYAHQQLCLVKPELENHPPDLPYEPRGIWSLLYSLEIPENFNQWVESYLSRVAQICGNELLTDYLFNRDVLAEQYFENCSELRQKAYMEHELRLVEELQGLFRKGTDLVKMVDMIELYSDIDRVLAELATARAEVFNIMLQPFVDMRELSFNKLLGLQDELEDEFMSQGRRDRCLMDYSVWQEEYVGAIGAINEIRVKYFARCMETTKDVIKQLEKDKLKFGKSTWAISGEGRWRDFNQMLSQETVQLLQARQDKYKHQIEKTKQEMVLLDEGPSYIAEMESLEQLTFDLQVKVYDTQLEVLQEHDKMHRQELALIKEQLKEAEEEDIFFDALDSLLDIDLGEDDDDDDYANGRGGKKCTDPRIQTIQSKLSRINRRRARIRSSKQSYVAQHNARITEKKSEEDKFKLHHWVQMKRDQLLAEQEQKKNFIQSERRKTLDRLRNYKVSHPSPKILKPQQYKKTTSKDEASGKKEAEAAKAREKREAAAARDKARRSYQPPRPTKSKTKNATGIASLKANGAKPGAIPQSPAIPPPTSVPPPPPAPPPPAAPPPPPPCPPPPTCPPPPVRLSSGTTRGRIVNGKEKGREEERKGLDLSEILKARGNLQQRPRAGSNHSGGGANTDPMVATLANIRQGVTLRKIRREPETTASPYNSLETTELDAVFSRIKRIRDQTEIPSDDSDSDVDFSP